MPWKSGNRSKRESQELAWGQRVKFGRWGLFGLVMILLAVAGLITWLAVNKRGGDGLKQEHYAGVVTGMEVEEAPSVAELDRRAMAAEEVVEAFLAEPEAEKRLAWVRNTERVREHWEGYDAQALTATSRQWKRLGMSVVEGLSVTAFAVAFEDGTFRLLEVVEGEDGLCVDWDAYARYCSVPLSDFVAGRGPDEALVRIFVRPGDYYNAPFDDRSKWVGFRFESPDMELGQYAFGVGDSQEIRRLQEYVIKTKQLRQHATLRLKRRESLRGQYLFEIVEVVAIGWSCG